MSASVPRLILITDRHLCQSGPLSDVIAAALAGGVLAVQLREKDLPASQLFELARELRAMVGDRALLLINDRVDVAIAASAHGIHLPGAGLPVAAARKIVGPDFLIGRSVHSIEEAAVAAADGADYVQVGPIFATQSKPGAVGAGLDLVRRVKETTSTAVIAVGGVNAGNVRSVLQAGADGVAVISAIIAAKDPAQATRDLVANMS